MNSSRTQLRTKPGAASTAKHQQKITAIQQLSFDLQSANLLPGSFNDAFIIRGILVDAIKRSGKSRIQLAEEMSLLTGREITERMLNGFTAESKEDYRWPAELDRAFCHATGDDRLLTCRVEQAGLQVINGEEADVLKLGRQYLIRKSADEQIALLEARLRGVTL